MQEGQNARQQIVERIRQSTSILVAVANSPSVDALSAALGLSLMLNKMNKHTTALFSGEIPPAIQFLEPSKLFESNVDALRDFIISLDKEKADRLRYKVEDDVVRIFITPYKTSIGQADLQFSQGDFNVDLIIALGVEKRDDLDKVIIAHGRILHDATVITINANNQRSTLGAIDWNDATASSLCEMLAGMSEAFQQPGLLDTQIATALLTGIVAETERFSNVRTSPRVMTMAAQLMAAGANQQLIATNLTKAHEIPEVSRPMAKQQAAEAPQPMPQESTGKKNDGELAITHDQKAEQPSPSAQLSTQAADEATKAAEAELEAALPSATEVSNHVLADLKGELEKAEPSGVQSAATGDEPKAPGSESVNSPVRAHEPEHGEDEEYISSHSSWRGKRLEPPTLGGTLNATSEEAQKENQAELETDRNKTLLSHPDDTAAPADGQQKQKRSRKDRRDKSKKTDETPVAPVVAPAPLDQPAPVPEPSEPAQVVAPAIAQPQAEATPPLPPMPEMPPLPPMPPMPQDTAALPPIPEPQAPAPALPPVAAEPELNLDALQKEAAQSAAEAAAQAPEAPQVPQAPQPPVDLDTARQAVSDALNAEPFNPAGQPAESIGAQPLPPMPVMPVMEPGQGMAANPQDVPMPPMPEMPPLPPMPPMPQADTTTPLPPAPNLPGLTDPVAPVAPINQAPQQPQAPTNDPGQFKIPGA